MPTGPTPSPHSPATLIQRFQSKIGLMTAAINDGMAEFKELGDPVMMANSLAQLHVELSHDELRPLFQAYTAGIVQVFQTLVEAAIEVGELDGIDAKRLGQIIYTTWSGAMVTYAISGDGTVVEWVTCAIDCILQPYRTQAE